MDLKTRLLKNSTIKDAASLAASRLFEKKDIITLPCKMLNLALSGDAMNGGMCPGIIQIAAESKHFKSKFALEMVKAFLYKFPEGVVLFYDSEYGTPESYFNDIDLNNIIHTPIVNLEEFKHDIVKQLNEIERGEKVLILVDSLGNIPSLKELSDAESGKDTQDMTRAKVMKSVFRMIMSLINQKDIYSVMVNHTYKTIEMYSKDIPTGGCLVEGINIILSDGSLCDISKVNIGDNVNTLLGSSVVTEIWNPDNLIEGMPECFEIEFEDGYIVQCSENHKFLINNEWVKASDLILEQEVQTI